ncbi:hypothetical protein FACS189421_06460 [Bacteroidia bacterium]|nr:hypothetical protein FACS189421_06460 [Bacteroidia bacterium]
MKKLTFTLVLCFIAGISFGQKKAVNDAKAEIKVKSTASNSTSNLDEARTLIQGALKNPETMNEAETWYVAGQIEEKQFESEQTKEVMGLKPNEDLMYKSLSKIAPYFVKADELDQLPDAKGKVKPKYRKDIKAIIQANRPYYVNAGSYFYDKEDYQQAYENFKFYGDIPKLPMYAGDAKLFEVLADDTTAIKIRYYAGLAASLIPNPQAAIEIFDEIKDLGFNENEIYQRIAVAYTQQHDTVNFIKILEKGAAKFPEDPYYTLNLINLYIGKGETDKAIDYLQKALALSPNDAQLYDVLGLVYENTKEPDKAIESIKKAIEINPDNADALSHLGRLYYNTGIEARGEADNITDSKLYNEAIKKVDNYFQQAIPYFEKAYQLNNDDSDAVFALRNIYYSLGNNEAYEKWDKIYSGK